MGMVMALPFFFLTHFRSDFMSDDEIKHLDNLRDLFLGPVENLMLNNIR